MKQVRLFQKVYDGFVTLDLVIPDEAHWHVRHTSSGGEIEISIFGKQGDFNHLIPEHGTEI